MIRTAFIASAAALALAACQPAETPPAAPAAPAPAAAATHAPAPAAPAPAADPAPPAASQAPTADAIAAAPIVGGYGPADLADAETKAAQKIAMDEVYKREPQRGVPEKVTAEVQVVAGLNYSFDIKMTANHYHVVVFRPLKGKMQVTTFEKLAN